MEWYDFALYGFMASILADLFFPGESAVASLLAAYGVFAVGFVMRPIGSAFFGWLGDTIGRSQTMLISVSMMVIPTVGLGLLPTYATIGLAAPVLLIVIRLVQGLSVGGEFSSSATYLVETAPTERRGFAGSWVNVGSMTGMLLGAGFAAAVTTVLEPDVVKAWGWRIPFLIGGVMGLGAIYLRRHLPKSEQFAKHEKEHGRTSPLVEAFTENRIEMLQGTLFASAYGALFYLALVYMPTWISQYTSQSLDTAMRYNTLATAILVPLLPVIGWISDNYVRRTHILAAVMVGFIVLAIPLHLWIHSGSTLAVILVQILYALLIAGPCAVGPALFVELFPTRDRLSGYSVAFNIGLGVIGGATPAAVTGLIALTGLEIMPALYMTFAGLLGAGTLFWMHDRSREPLR
jgi:MHS family proline/betaine transporter-like MFS transporter